MFLNFAQWLTHGPQNHGSPAWLVKVNWSKIFIALHNSEGWKGEKKQSPTKSKYKLKPFKQLKNYKGWSCLETWWYIDIGRLASSATTPYKSYIWSSICNIGNGIQFILGLRGGTLRMHWEPLRNHITHGLDAFLTPNRHAIVWQNDVKLKVCIARHAHLILSPLLVETFWSCAASLGQYWLTFNKSPYRVQP